jgi:hypothetical protein
MTPLRTTAVALSTLSIAFTLGCRSVTNIDTAKYDFPEVRPNATGLDRPTTGDFELRTKNWKHEWRCNVFETCLTDFESTIFVFDRRTGKQVNWNRIEVFMKEACDASAQDRKNYKTVTNSDTVSFGWGKNRDGKYDQVSAYLVFYADWGSVNALVKTRACP